MLYIFRHAIYTHTPNYYQNLLICKMNNLYYNSINNFGYNFLDKYSQLLAPYQLKLTLPLNDLDFFHFERKMCHSLEINGLE